MVVAWVGQRPWQDLLSYVWHVYMHLCADIHIYLYLFVDMYVERGGHVYANVYEHAYTLYVFVSVSSWDMYVPVYEYMPLSVCMRLSLSLSPFQCMCMCVYMYVHMYTASARVCSRLTQDDAIAWGTPNFDEVLFLIAFGLGTSSSSLVGLNWHTQWVQSHYSET